MISYKAVYEVKVGLNFGDEIISVGRLAVRSNNIYFEYDDAFIQKKIEISPLKLPLQAGLFKFDRDLFEGLPGVFNDSLPDGWGRLLFDRFVRSQGILPETLTALDRLSYTGNHGMGALIYEPDRSTEEARRQINLDELAQQAQDVLEGQAADVLQSLLALNGSSGGARPKALIVVDKRLENISYGVDSLDLGSEHWLVKFANTQDGSDAGAIEYVYGLMAKNSGIDMPDIHLFPSGTGAGYFATKRFDRDGSKKFHMHTVSGLLHSDFRTPSLDYEDLITLTGVLTRDVREMEKMFRLAVFNVMAHNRDDHAKNFSFLMDKNGEWKLSPAYDLTFSSGPGGEQSMMVMGEGKNPSKEHLIKLGLSANLKQKSIDAVIDQTANALSNWKTLAKQYGVSKLNIELIDNRIHKT